MATKPDLKPIIKSELAEKWTLQWAWNDAEGAPNEDLTIQTDIPCSVFGQLIEHEIIKDPFYGNREHDVAWIYESDWIFTKMFDMTFEKAKFIEYQEIYLRFHGLDTLATIELNDVVLGKTNNMFRMYEFEVKNLLKEKANKLVVHLKSPTKEARRRVKETGHRLNTGDFTLPGIPHIRKAPYSFGWDWGPKLPDIGIWKKIELVGSDGVEIKSLKIDQELDFTMDPTILPPEKLKDLNANSVKLSITPEFFIETIIRPEQPDKTDDLTVYAVIKNDNGEIVAEQEKKLKEFYEKPLVFRLENPKLWWVHNLGDPTLYSVEVSILDQKTEVSIDKIIEKIGLREIKLIQRQDKWGESFFFRLNGIPVFAKGANWIPIDSFIPRGQKIGLYEKILKNTKAANMNMLRVWGGGIYETEEFYNLCDELGIMIWQDFPFACAVYPPDDEFYENFKIEAVQNIKRLRNRACLALWCGNNEIEMGWLWYTKGILNPFERKEFKHGYKRIFEKFLPSLTAELDSQHPYWPSSPSNGTIDDGGPLNSNNPDKGDSHYWMVWHGGKPFTAYRKFDSRFMSEFGFESFPPMKTIREFCPPDQFEFDSEIMENHQKNSAGNKKIMNYMKKRFSIPATFEQQVELSQITHAEAMEYGIEHWRRNRNDEHCMGSLYWQINDCWPVASWASLDYYVRWKALHYFAKRIYKNIFPSVEESSKEFSLWITNDTLDQFEGELDWYVYDEEDKVLKSGTLKANVPANSAKNVETIDCSDINRFFWNRKKHVIFYNLRSKTSNEIIYRGIRFFDAPKKFPMKQPRLTFAILNDNIEKSGSAKIRITSKNTAFYVFLQSDTYDFVASDNYVSLKPNEAIDIELSAILPVTTAKIKGKEFLESLKLKSLYDLMY